MNSTNHFPEASTQNTSLEFMDEIATSPDISQWLHHLGLLVYEYYTPLLCIFGTLGNSLSIVVFLKDSKYRKQSSSYYLSSLAVSDTIYLFNLFAVWLGSITNGVITYNFICPLVMYIGHLTSFVTVYLTMAFSLERYIAIYFPFRRPQFCTIAKTKLVIGGIISLGLIAFTYVWVVAEVIVYPLVNSQDRLCAVADRFHKISEIANYLDTMLIFIVPFVLIAFLNLKVVIKVCQKEHSTSNVNRNKEIQLPIICYKPRDILRTLQIPVAFMDGLRVVLHYEIKTTNQRKTRLSQIRVTKTLLLVTSMFLILNLPLHVLRCAQFIQHRLTILPTEELKLTLSLQPWAFMLFNTNFAINMLLYSLSGTKFRNSLRNIFNLRKN